MLVLSRFTGETIVINGDITIKVLSVDRGKVRLGIECDASIPVHRGEIHEKIKEERKAE